MILSRFSPNRQQATWLWSIPTRRYRWRSILGLRYRGEHAVAMLDRACRTIGYPKVIGVGNGSEFICRYMDLWVYRRCDI